MSLLATTHPTLLDVTKRLDPDGKIARLAEMLHQTNEILDDMVWIEGNLPTGHRTSVRTGLPQGTWRKLYGGVQPTKGTTAQVTDNCGMLEAYAEVDKALADLNGNTAAFRLSEDAAHVEGINQQLAAALWYETEATNPERITGLSPRFSSLTAANGGNIVNVTSGGGADAPSSIWLVVWGPNTVHGIYPKGSKAGLQMTDKGQVTIENVDGAGGRMEAYRSHYKWDCGLCVRDWRYVARAQFDAGELLRAHTSGAILFDLMTQMLELVPNLSMGRPAFYMNRPTRSMLRRQMVAATGSSTLSMDNIAGKLVMNFDGVPVRRSDQLLNGTETRVS
jgi:hypothetical protein